MISSPAVICCCALWIISGLVHGSAQASGTTKVCMYSIGPNTVLSLFDGAVDAVTRAVRFGTGRVVYGGEYKKMLVGRDCDAYLATFSSSPSPYNKEDMTIPLRSRLPLEIQNKSVIVMMNENCNAFYTLREQSDMVVYYGARDPPHVVNFPLGPSYTVAFVSETEAAAHPASRRRYFYNLVVSESTGNATKQGGSTRRMWRETALDWRLKLARGLQRNEPRVDDPMLPPGVQRCAYIAVSMQWTKPFTYLGAKETEARGPRSDPVSFECPQAGARSRTGVTNSHIPQREWRHVLLNSVFTLSPAGHNIECFRFWEAAEAGSIPVLIANEGSQHGGYNVTESGCQLHPDIMAHAPFIFANDLHEAWRSMLALAADPSALDRRAAQVREWYSQYLRRSMERVENLFLMVS